MGRKQTDMREAEHELARRWRVENRYTLRKISELTGYSLAALTDFENGASRNTGKPISARVMRRYRLCLAAIDAGKADWNYGA